MIVNSKKIRSEDHYLVLVGENHLQKKEKRVNDQCSDYNFKHFYKRSMMIVVGKESSYKFTWQTWLYIQEEFKMQNDGITWVDKS